MRRDRSVTSDRMVLRVLAIARTYDKGPYMPDDIAFLSRLSEFTVSKLLTRLRKAGYVSNVPGGWVITDAGAAKEIFLREVK